MTVLLTEAASPLGRALAAQLGPDVRLTDRPGAADDSMTASTFGPDDATDALVEGVDVLVHLTGAASTATGGVTDTEWVDACIRVGRLLPFPTPHLPPAPDSSSDAGHVQPAPRRVARRRAEGGARDHPRRLPPLPRRLGLPRVTLSGVSPCPR